MERSKTVAREAVENAAARACVNRCHYKNPSNCPICFMFEKLGYDEPCTFLDERIEAALENLTMKGGSNA